jgi:triosephosphate isomerase
MKKMLIAGNWKMNKTNSETIDFISKLNELIGDSQYQTGILICPTFTSLYTAGNYSKSSQIKTGSQNCYFEPKGAFTGEISIDMIKECKADYIIIGHSERRAIFGESDELINKKALAILNNNLIPIICIGETLDQRQTNQTESILKNQIIKAFKDISEDVLDKVVIAYEPVWAIGTGVTATEEQINDTHNFIRDLLAEMYPNKYNEVIIQYGGSVNKANSDSILNIKNVNGALIGGASLIAEDFFTIINIAEKYV